MGSGFTAELSPRTVITLEKTYGLRAVKLTDIPLDQRMSAARYAARQLCVDEAEAESILYAALLPSDTIYWVRAQAAAPELLAA